ncbi:TPA: ribonuclease BN [Kluyvera intermedia]|uniref:Ribonuclease BN n=2 Tax=Enterobacteriaceae TaxID=543 RepID=A0A9P3T6D7_KLUIN|nr:MULTISPECIES: ribonuclease BN [Enterobacteriaceae]MCL9669965.1 ribonuclease BN [Citrobacter sp. MNAZ 1397]MDU6683801.1 ribonuclease BN [Enterobacteriaceae bacterium]AKL11071.1 ribonuclease Z [Phytobacter ursingii]ORJ51872.1 ribonuclease Z [Kluyvera intermedia]HAT2203955.1 ribonuclease BN [Kluyvera intermedia]
MELIFLGTSAGVPTRTRNVTAILLNLQHPTQAGLWLFDCGEGTQHQLLRTSFNPGKLDRIFITHLHGDHLFGLPGLLCSRSMAGNAQPLTIYGPKGIREFVETSLRLSGSWTDYPLTIEEVSEGLVVDDGLRRVTAFALNHPVECYGYRIEEHDKAGALDAQALIALGITPGPLFQRLKSGETVTLPDGRIVHGEDFLAPAIPGKKLAIFGDTAPCPAALQLAQGVDIMVHEATLEYAMEEKANSRGHSSTHQAAQLARDAGAGRLVITHVSSRYDAEGSQHLLTECRTIFAHTTLAKDFYTITL